MDGHSTLVGVMKRVWQDVDFVLSHFGQMAGEARVRYRESVASGVAQGRLVNTRRGGGGAETAGMASGIGSRRRGRERWAYDECVLGGSDFIEGVWEEA